MATFRDRLADRLKGLTGPTDELERQITSLLERATSEMWISPDWGLNMELVDLINTNQNSSTYEKLFRATRRRLGKGNPKVQMLVLTVLETCVKNCGPSFHASLGGSDLWAEVAKMTDPRRKADVQVKDRVLTLIEDFAKSLRPTVFQKTYTDLKTQGVRFPERPEEEVGLGIDATPPNSPQNERPLVSGVSEADQRAIQAALQELEEADAQRQRAQPQGGEAQARGIPVEASPGVAVTPVNQVEKLKSDLKFARNSVDLLVDALGSIPSNEPEAVRQEFIRDLVQQCVEIKPRLMQVIDSVTDEEVLGEALTLFEDLSKAQTRYDELAGPQPHGAEAGAEPGQRAGDAQLVRNDTSVSEEGGPTLVTNRRFPQPTPPIPSDPADLLSAPVPGGEETPSTAPAGSIEDEFTKLAVGEKGASASHAAPTVAAGFEQLASERVGGAGAEGSAPETDEFNALVMERSAPAQPAATTPPVPGSAEPASAQGAEKTPEQAGDLISF